jgi:hypothetical protein
MLKKLSCVRILSEVLPKEVLPKRETKASAKKRVKKASHQLSAI